MVSSNASASTSPSRNGEADAEALAAFSDDCRALQSSLTAATNYDSVFASLATMCGMQSCSHDVAFDALGCPLARNGLSFPFFQHGAVQPKRIPDLQKISRLIGPDLKKPDVGKSGWPHPRFHG